jgi:hypothetical protein
MERDEKRALIAHAVITLVLAVGMLIGGQILI